MDEHQPIAIVFIFIFTITRINYSSLHLGHLVEEPRVALTGARRLLRLARRLRRLGVTLFLLHTLDAIHCQKNVSLCRVVRVGRLWASIGFLRLLQFDIQPLGFVVVAQIHFDHPLRHLALPDFEFLHTRRRIGRLALLRRYLRRYLPPREPPRPAVRGRPVATQRPTVPRRALRRRPRGLRRVRVGRASRRPSRPSRRWTSSCRTSPTSTPEAGCGSRPPQAAPPGRPTTSSRSAGTNCFFGSTKTFAFLGCARHRAS
eukprot:Selendium_serpulae@DN5243_c0_g1_i5.p1